VHFDLILLFPFMIAVAGYSQSRFTGKPVRSLSNQSFGRDDDVLTATASAAVHLSFESVNVAGAFILNGVIRDE
jgi:hypothetical protein